MKLSKDQIDYMQKYKRRANIYEKEKQRFLMLPAGLVYGELYKDLSPEAKFAWTILNDRAKLSKRNGWYDSNGDVYFLFTNSELQEILNMSEPKVIKVKTELIKHYLLEQVRQGLGKANRLYMFEPILTAGDYKLMLKDDSETELPFNKTPENVDMTQNLKFLSSRTKDSSGQELNSFKSNNNNINNNDFNNDSESAKAESKNDENTNQYFEKSELLIDFSYLGIPKTVTEEIYRATRDTTVVGDICGIIFQAKKYVSNKKKQDIYLEDLADEDFSDLTKIIIKTLKKQMTDKTVNDFDKYLFVSIKNFFDRYLLEKQVPLINWVE